MGVFNPIFFVVFLFCLSTAKVCTFSKTFDSTVLGNNMANSGQAFSTADGCLNLCCNTANCVAATYVTSWGGCYLKDDGMMKSNNVVKEIGTQLLKITGQKTTSTSCKRGVAYGQWLSNQDFTTLMSKLTWYYEWSPAPGSVSASARGKVEFVPMIWGEGHIQSLSSVPSGSKFLLGFNEPNFQSQSNLTPQRAASLWPAIQRYADANNLKLVSPALNFCGGACNIQDPIEWLKQFFQACSNCRVDYIAMHSYTCEVQYLREHVNLYKIFKKPIWLTEFACGDMGNQPESKQIEYMKSALAYLDSDPDVFRYAWFSGRTNEIQNVNLLLSNAQISNLGNVYLSDYSCGASAAVTELEANSETPSTVISPTAAIVASAFVLFVIVLPVVAFGGYICYKKRRNLTEIV